VLRRFAVLSVVLALVVCTQAQRKPKGVEQEQTSFGADSPPDDKAMKKPVTLPETALRALTRVLDHRDLDCIKRNEGLTAEQIPADWFVASEIRLNGKKDIGLVAVPAAMSDATPRPSGNACFIGAHIVSFWILRKTADGYGSVFTIRADAMHILKSKTNGYRDVQAFFLTGAGQYITTVTFHFDGRMYQKFKSETVEQK